MTSAADLGQIVPGRISGGAAPSAARSGRSAFLSWSLLSKDQGLVAGGQRAELRAVPVTKHSGSLSFPLKLMGLDRVLVSRFSPNLSLNACSPLSSPILLPGLCVTSAVTDAENPSPAFIFPSTFLGKLMKVVLLHFDKLSFLECVFMQQAYCLTGEVNQAFVRTEQPDGNSYNTHLRDLFENRFPFWPGVGAFPSLCCGESPCQQLPVVGYTSSGAGLSLGGL